jgi:hypothetical protein
MSCRKAKKRGMGTEGREGNKDKRDTRRIQGRKSRSRKKEK